MSKYIAKEKEGEDIKKIELCNLRNVDCKNFFVHL